MGFLRDGICFEVCSSFSLQHLGKCEDIFFHVLLLSSMLQHQRFFSLFLESFNDFLLTIKCAVEVKPHLQSLIYFVLE